jgi:hypothetical protein
MIRRSVSRELVEIRTARRWGLAIRGLWSFRRPRCPAGRCVLHANDVASRLRRPVAVRVSTVGSVGLSSACRGAFVPHATSGLIEQTVDSVSARSVAMPMDGASCVAAQTALSLPERNVTAKCKGCGTWSSALRSASCAQSSCGATAVTENRNYAPCGPQQLRSVRLGGR